MELEMLKVGDRYTWPCGCVSIITGGPDETNPAGVAGDVVEACAECADDYDEEDEDA